MKRLLLLAAPVIFILAGYWFITWDPNAPRFRTIGQTYVPPSSTYVYYHVFNVHLPTDSTLWLSVGGTNWQRTLRFNVKQKRVTGELLGATPMFSDKEGRNLVCLQRGVPRLSWNEKLKALVERVSFGKVRWSKPPATAAEMFWLVNLQSGAARRLGQRTMPARFSVAFTASPTGRYGFSAFASGSNTLMYLCDVAENRWWTMPVPDWPHGWWDERTLIVRTTQGFDLLDIDGATRPLLPRANIDAFFREHGIFDRNPTLASYWNGSQFEYYLFNNIHSQGEPSYFVRIRRPDAALELVSSNFEFEVAGQFDTSGTRYVYATRVVGDCCNGVSVRDLRTGVDRVLVAANSASAMSHPFFQGASICYLRSNELWSIEANGSNHVRLFPPER